MLKTLLRAIAVPILMLAVVALPVSLALRSVGAVLFDAETTKALARESLMGSELARSLARRSAQQLVSSDGLGESASLASVLDQLGEEDWRQITEIIAPERVLVQTVDIIVDAFSNWLDDAEAPFPDLQLSLAALKTNASEQAEEITMVILNALPPCDATSASTFAAQALGGEASFSMPLCRPEEPVYSQVVLRAGDQLSRIVSGGPDSIDLSQITDGQQAPEELIHLKQNLIRLRFSLAWGWALVIVIGLITAALAARGFASTLRWAGWPATVAGLLTLVIALSVFIFSYSFLDSLLSPALGGDSPAMAALAGALAGGVLNRVGGPLLLQGLIVMAVGLAMLAYARAIDHREKSPGIPINRRKIGF